MQKKIAIEKLLNWYYKNSKKFPFRENPLPYNVWISEIMLQQTRMSAVLPYYTEFVNRFPSIKVLANASEETVLEHWRGLGYYNRARNIHKSANILLQNYNAKVPDSKEELIKLPGIGPYTASAISSIAFSAREIVLDGNVKRIASRLFLLASQNKEDYETQLNNNVYKAATNSAKNNDKLYGDINQALMDLGREICTPKNPNCTSCPLNLLCLATQKKLISNYPEPKKKQQLISVHLIFFLFEIKDNSTDSLTNNHKKNNENNIEEFNLEILFKKHSEEAFLKNSFFPPYITIIPEKKSKNKIDKPTDKKLNSKATSSTKVNRLNKYKYIPELLKLFWKNLEQKNITDFLKYQNINKEGQFVKSIASHAITQHKIQVHVIKKSMTYKAAKELCNTDPELFIDSSINLKRKMHSSLGKKIFKSVYENSQGNLFDK